MLSFIITFTVYKQSFSIFRNLRFISHFKIVQLEKYQKSFVIHLCIK